MYVISAISKRRDRLPVLWQLELSHYNEKVRWALDLKRIPHVRRAVYFVLLDHPDVVMPLFMHGQRLPARLLLRGMFPILKPLMRDRMRIEPEAAQHSRELTFAAMDRLERELGPSGYLVGDSFTIADLTAAALLYPVVLPPEFPYPLLAEVPPAGRDVIESLATRPGGRWVADMYARHRCPPA